MSPSTTTLIKKAHTARNAGSDTFADHLVALRKADAHKEAGFKAERPFYKTEFGIADRSLSDWTHAGRVRATLKAENIDLGKVGDAGVTSYAGVTPDMAHTVKHNLESGMTLKEALLSAAGHNSAAYENPGKAFDALLDDKLPPAFEALHLSLSVLGFSTPLETLKEGQAALNEAYEALGMILRATEENTEIENLLPKQ